MIILPNQPLNNNIIFNWQAFTPYSAHPVPRDQVDKTTRFVCYSGAHSKIDTGAVNTHVLPNYLSYVDKYTAEGYCATAMVDWALGNGKFFIDLVAQCRSASGDFTIFEVAKDSSNYFGLYRIYSTRALLFCAVSGGTVIAMYLTTSYAPWYGWWHISLYRDGSDITIMINGVGDTMAAITPIGTTALPSGCIYLYFGASVLGERPWQGTSALAIKAFRVCKGTIPVSKTGFAIAATPTPEDMIFKRIGGTYL